MMTRNPALHRAPLGYGKNGPLTWVAECRVPWGRPARRGSPWRRWMIENGSDVHQGGDGPLMRAALNGRSHPDDGIARRPRRRRERRVARPFPDHLRPVRGGRSGALSNGCWTTAPIRIAATRAECAGVRIQTRRSTTSSARTRARHERLRACIDLLLAAGGKTKIRRAGRAGSCFAAGSIELAAATRRRSALVAQRFPELDFGRTGERRLTAQRSDAAARGGGVRQSRGSSHCFSTAERTSMRARRSMSRRRRPDRDLPRGDAVR